jgi:putative ATP-binding cassette transporter
MALREALATPDPADERERVALVDHAADHLTLEDVTLALGCARATFDHARIEIAPGERVLIVGETSSDKSILFRAMAGLWPWGSGTIHLPPRRSMMFMPQRPYLPLGNLRTAVSYPAETGRFDDAAVSAALMRVGLGHLVPTLDHEQRWDKNLPLEEQQRLAFARLLLHQPRWVLIDDAMGALDEEQRRLMLSIFEHELADAAVINIGRSLANDGFYARILHFRRLSEGIVPVPLHPRLRRAPRVAAFASVGRFRARRRVASG